MRHLIAIFCVISSVGLMAQTQGISYQAVLVAETDQELPGKDVPGSILPNKAIILQFTITGISGIDYQERHQTTTDDYGLINVTIGEGEITGSSPGPFTDIDWDGTPKDLRVEINLLDEGSGLEVFSEQSLYFVPYAFHKNITATGTLIVDGATNLGSELNVDNGSATNLSGDY